MEFLKQPLATQLGTEFVRERRAGRSRVHTQNKSLPGISLALSLEGKEWRDAQDLGLPKIKTHDRTVPL